MGSAWELKSIDRFFLTAFKILPCHEVFLVTLFLPLVLKCSAKIILILSHLQHNVHRSFPSIDFNKGTKRVLIRFKQVHFPPQSWVFNAYHSLCYKLFLYVSIQSFFLRYFAVLCFSAGVLQKTFHAMISNRKKKDWCDVIHMLKLLMHFYWYIALLFFFKSSGVKLSITCFVPRATRERW